MSFSTGISKENERTEERRSSPRETLKRYVVLVFFGGDNWGKLTNMSESGMAFEFAKPPLSQERVNFTFQTMGCMPMPPRGKALGDSFEAPGKIVWTRDFERGAGVQFADLAESSREQIRQWLSFETSTNISRPAERVKPEAPPILSERRAPLGDGSNAQGAANKKESLLGEFDVSVPLAQPVPEADSAFLESLVSEKPYETPSWSDRGEAGKRPRVPESPATSNPSVARLVFFVVLGCLAAFAVTAGVRIFMTREAQRANASVRTRDPVPATGAAATEMNVPSPVSTATPAPVAPVTSSSATGSSGTGAPPFQVDVLDANGRSWILWFVQGEAPTMKTSKREEAGSPEKLQAAHTSIMAGLNFSHPLSRGGTENSSAEAPAIQPEMTPSLGGPIGGALGRQLEPAAPAVHAPTGGMVQQPRLIRATFPVYPQLAKSSRVSGDVVVDALIDTSGKVTTVKVVSGPALLRQAAIETVRRWKYEPARLDGQGVSMHLSVTVRFRLN